MNDKKTRMINENEKQKERKWITMKTQKITWARKTQMNITTNANDNKSWQVSKKYTEEKIHEKTMRMITKKINENEWGTMRITTNANNNEKNEYEWEWK